MSSIEEQIKNVQDELIEVKKELQQLKDDSETKAKDYDFWKKGLEQLRDKEKQLLIKENNLQDKELLLLKERERLSVLNAKWSWADNPSHFFRNPNNSQIWEEVQDNKVVFLFQFIELRGSDPFIYDGSRDLFAQIKSSTCEFMFGNSTNKNVVHGHWQITPQFPYEWNLPNTGEGECLVHLNVGGAEFCATSTTLKRSPFFNGIIEGSVPVRLDRCGRIYIERRPNVFNHILRCLIDFNQEKLSEIVSSLEQKDRSDFLSDADFYQITKAQPYVSLQASKYNFEKGIFSETSSETSSNGSTSPQTQVTNLIAKSANISHRQTILDAERKQLNDELKALREVIINDKQKNK